MRQPIANTGNFLSTLRRLSPPPPANSPQQNQLSAQTHSRRRAMLAPVTKIALPSCFTFFISLLNFNLHCATGAIIPLCR